MGTSNRITVSSKTRPPKEENSFESLSVALSIVEYEETANSYDLENTMRIQGTGMH